MKISEEKYYVIKLTEKEYEELAVLIEEGLRQFDFGNEMCPKWATKWGKRLDNINKF